MTNRPKEKGTRFETQVVRYLRERLADDRIERRALHGSRDMGDVRGLRSHGFEGIVECKAVAAWNAPKNLERWRAQAIAERGNAGAGFVALVVKVPNRNVSQSMAHVTMHDLLRIVGHDPAEGHSEWIDETWVSMTLDELCSLVLGPGLE